MVKKKDDIKTVVVSGGFDPVHIGHIRYFKEAKELGDKLIVILNTDEWLWAKKGYVFMSFEDRKEILESIRYVDEIVKCIDTDHTVSKTLIKLRPDIFAKGGDRTLENIPEAEICRRLGIEMKFNVGGGKIRSSSWIVEALNKNKESIRVIRKLKQRVSELEREEKRK